MSLIGLSPGAYWLGDGGFTGSCCVCTCSLIVASLPAVYCRQVQLVAFSFAAFSAMRPAAAGTGASMIGNSADFAE